MIKMDDEPKIGSSEWLEQMNKRHEAVKAQAEARKARQQGGFQAIPEGGITVDMPKVKRNKSGFNPTAKSKMQPGFNTHAPQEGNIKR